MYIYIHTHIYICTLYSGALGPLDGSAAQGVQGGFREAQVFRAGRGGPAEGPKCSFLMGLRGASKLYSIVEYSIVEYTIVELSTVE